MSLDEPTSWQERFDDVRSALVGPHVAKYVQDAAFHHWVDESARLLVHASEDAAEAVDARMDVTRSIVTNAMRDPRLAWTLERVDENGENPRLSTRQEVAEDVDELLRQHAVGPRLSEGEAKAIATLLDELMGAAGGAQDPVGRAARQLSAMLWDRLGI